MYPIDFIDMALIVAITAVVSSLLTIIGMDLVDRRNEKIVHAQDRTLTKP